MIVWQSSFCPLGLSLSLSAGMGTYQIPLLLKQRVREKVVCIRVPVFDARFRGNVTQQGPLIWISAVAKYCVITFLADLFVLLLHPSHLNERARRRMLMQILLRSKMSSPLSPLV